MKRTKTLAVCSLMAAMCVAILALGSLFEVMDVTVAIVAGLVVMIVDTEYGFRAGLSVFLVAGFLALLLPVKFPAVFFIALGGWYPLVQKSIHLRTPVVAAVIKFLIFNGVLTILLLLSAFVMGVREAGWVYPVLYVMGNVCFFMYDILLDRFMLWYILKLRNRLKF